MSEEIAFENGRISNFERLVTLTLDRVIMHTVVHHSSISTMTNFTEIDKTFCERIRTRARQAMTSCTYVPYVCTWRHRLACAGEAACRPAVVLQTPTDDDDRWRQTPATVNSLAPTLCAGGQVINWFRAGTEIIKHYHFNNYENWMLTKNSSCGKN